MAGGCFLWGEGTVHIRQRRSFSFFSLRYAPVLKQPEIRAPFSHPAISLSQFLASRNPVRHQPNMENVHIISTPRNLTSSDPPYLLKARVPYQARWHHQGYFKTPTKLLHSRMSCSPGNNVVVFWWSKLVAHDRERWGDDPVDLSSLSLVIKSVAKMWCRPIKLLIPLFTN